MQDAGYWKQDAGYRILDGCRDTRMQEYKDGPYASQPGGPLKGAGGFLLFTRVDLKCLSSSCPVLSCFVLFRHVSVCLSLNCLLLEWFLDSVLKGSDRQNNKLARSCLRWLVAQAPSASFPSLVRVIIKVVFQSHRSKSDNKVKK